MQPNPFSTVRIRPGAIEYVMPEGSTPQQLIEQLQSHKWRGQILGPHGSGKSTLLATLGPLLTQSGRQVVWITLRQGERRLPLSRRDRHPWNHETLLIIDGYEQLGRWQRWRLHRLCRQQNLGLLVTTHTDLGLPTLWQTEQALKKMPQVVQALLPPGQTRIDAKQVDAILAIHQENAREALFSLYDLWEDKSPDSSAENPHPAPPQDEDSSR